MSAPDLPANPIPEAVHAEDALRIVRTAMEVCEERDRPAMAEDLESVRLYIEQTAALATERDQLAAAPQPPSGGEVSEVTRLLVERDAAGRKKYGTTLDRTDLSHADWLQHMAEELLDAAGYALAAKRTAPPSASVGVGWPAGALSRERTLEVLREHNAWRRGARGPQTDPRLLGLALDAAIAAPPPAAAQQPSAADEATRRDAERWRAMRKLLVAVDFAPEMGGGPVAMFECHSPEVRAGAVGADEIADAAIAAEQTRA